MPNKDPLRLILVNIEPQITFNMKVYSTPSTYEIIANVNIISGSIDQMDV